MTRARSPDESSRDEAATDLQDLAKLQALYASMLDRLAKLPRYRIISLEWRSPGGGRRRAAGGVVQANRERVELHAGPQTVFVEWPDATASSLLATMPSDVADARTAALFCLVDGDVEAARIYAGGRTEILPSKYWARAARRTATLPSAPAGELESRELLYQAERDFRSKETRPGAVEGYRRLLKEYQDSRVVVSLVERIRRRSEPGPAEPFEDWVDPALVAYWPFDEPAGEQAADASGRGHRVTAPGARRTDGRVGGALLLDAAAGFGSTPDAQDLRLSECFSASFWVRLDVHEAAHVRLLGKGDLQDTTFGIYALASSERKVMLQQQSEGFWFHLESTKLLSKGEWAHVAAVADGKHVVLYVNGEKDAEGDRRIVPPPGPPDALTIGRGPGFGAGLTGALDDVRLFSRVLGEQEVRALYDAGR